MHFAEPSSMKSANDTKLQNQEPEEIDLELENITQETRHNSEEEEMDSENKKEKVYSQNKQVQLGMTSIYCKAPYH